MNRFRRQVRVARGRLGLRVARELAYHLQPLAISDSHEDKGTPTTSGHIWRRTATERNGRLVPLPDDWSLWDAASGLAIARINAEPDGRWRCVCRSVDSNELKDSIMGWFKTGKQAKEFVESQTKGQYYVVKPKRTTVEVLRRAGVK